MKWLEYWQDIYTTTVLTENNQGFAELHSPSSAEWNLVRRCPRSWAGKDNIPAERTEGILSWYIYKINLDYDTRKKRSFTCKTTEVTISFFIFLDKNLFFPRKSKDSKVETNFYTRAWKMKWALLGLIFGLTQKSRGKSECTSSAAEKQSNSTGPADCSEVTPCTESMWIFSFRKDKEERSAVLKTETKVQLEAEQRSTKVLECSVKRNPWLWLPYKCAW